MVKSWQKDRLSLWLVIFLVLLVCLGNLAWRATDQTPPHWDMARHLANSLQYYDFASLHRIRSLIGHYSYYPPFVYWLTVPFYILFGKSLIAPAFVGSVFILILGLSSFFTVKKLFGARLAVMAVALTLSFPMMAGQFREYQLDAPLSAMVSLGICLLIYSERFVKSKYAIWFGLVSGFGMLTKWTYVVYVFPIALVIILAGLIKEENQRRRLIVLNLVWSLLLLTFTAGPWYWHNRTFIRADVAGSGINAARAEGDPIGFTKEAFLYYFWTLLEHHLWITGTVLGFFSALACLLNRQLRQKTWIFISVILIGYLIFSIFANKDTRFIMPMIPAFAVLIAGAISLLPRKISFALGGLLVAYAVFSYSEAGFGWPLGKSQSYHIDKTHTAYLYGVGSYTNLPPNSANWHFDDIMESIKKDGQLPQTIQFAGQDCRQFNRWDVDYYAWREGFGWPGEDMTKINYHYLIFRSVASGDFAEMSQQISDAGASSKLLNRWPLPDGSQALLYRISLPN